MHSEDLEMAGNATSKAVPTSPHSGGGSMEDYRPQLSLWLLMEEIPPIQMHLLGLSRT